MIKNSDCIHTTLRHPALVADIADMQLMDDTQWQQVGRAFAFSNRELEICNHLFLGETRQQIADQLGIKPRTVRHYMEKIHKKMNVKSRVGVVLRVIAARDLLCFQKQDSSDFRLRNTEFKNSDLD